MASIFTDKTSCCFTGHRPDGLPAGTADMIQLRRRLMHAVTAAADAGVTHFLAGGARGFDTLAAEAVLFLRAREDRKLSLTLALPSVRQAERFPPDDAARYSAVLDAADAVCYAPVQNGTEAMHWRNRYLVDHADCCIAYLKKLSGGTLYTVNYALQHEIPVLNLAREEAP